MVNAYTLGEKRLFSIHVFTLYQSSLFSTIPLCKKKIGFKIFHHFFKDPSGRFVVLYSYNAQDENDLSVERGQCVTVLNSDDPDWYWVSKFDGQEGFVPSGFIYPLDAIQRQREFPVYVTVSSKYLLTYIFLL